MDYGYCSNSIQSIKCSLRFVAVRRIMTELTAANFNSNADEDRNCDQQVDCICTFAGYRKYTFDYYQMTAEESDKSFHIQRALQNGREGI